MGTLVQESDIDYFIRGHKDKLQEERNQLNQFTEQSRYAGGQQVTSPSSRKQWDRSQAQGTRPAEEKRAPVEPEETGLPFNYGEQEKKRQQLQSERHQEYNDMLAQRNPKLRRRPRTPSEKGLPLGQYEKRRKAYEEERQKEMKQAMEAKKAEKPRRANVFDYHEAEKTHMEEKRKEYNEYLDKKRQQKRHIVTPEEGMFIGPDQSERDKQIREKNRKNRQALEEQQREQLLFKARQHGQIPEHSPRKGPLSNNRQHADVPYKPPPPPTPPPGAGQRPDKGQGYGIEERVMDMPKVSPRRNEPAKPEPKVAFMPEQQQRSLRLPLFMEDSKEGQGRDRQRGQGQLEHNRDDRRERVKDRQPVEQYSRYDRREGPEKSQGYPEYERGRQQYRPQLEVRRSRSLSPPAERRRHKSPEELLEEQRRMIEKLRERQQILQEEYRRELAEEQRLASEREGLPIGASDRQKLGEERNREYNEYLAKKGQQGSSRRADVLEGTGATLPVGEYDENKRQQLNSERAREYNEQQQQKLATQRQRGLPPKPPTPNHFFKNIGQHERQQQMLNEERKKEYNQKLSEERGRTAGRGNYGAEQVNTGLPFKSTDSAEARKIRARNEEYNEYLREKQWKDAHRFDNKKPATAASRRHSEPSSPRGKKEYATLPGLHYSDSAEKRKMQERNKEYNDFLRQKQTGGKKGWATPSYEEILEQKRREEAFRRQDDDYEPAGMRRYASEGAINRLQNDFREKELDKEFESRKVRFDDEFKTQHGGILEDDNWLNPEQRREQEYKQLVAKIYEAEQPPKLDLPDDMAARVRQQPAFLASLPVGGAPGLGAGQDERESAKKRRQSDYRRELQLQMEEAKAAKKREKMQELRVNASGLLDPEKNSQRMRGLEGQPGISPRREYKAKEVQPYHTKFLLDDSGDYDALGHRPGEYVRTAPANVGQQGRLQGLGLGGLGLGSGDDLRLELGGGGGGRDRGRRRDRDIGLLDPGFAGLLESRRPLGTANPPPGLMYQPSTYVTGGGGVGGPYSSIDEAYHYYGMKNPLDIDSGGGGGGIPNLNLGGDFGGGGVPVRGSPTPRVTFADDPPSTRRRDRSKERISPYQFPSDEENRSKSRSESQNYGAELERQIQEKRMQKLREKEEQQRYDRKLEEEIANYNPYGKAGGGAPIKDEHGKAIADLRSLQRGGPGSYHSPRREVSPTYSPRPPSPRDDKIRTPPLQQTAFGESTYARGGHGIFGRPKTEAEKDVSEKYKDELREQIAEKRRREQMEKERERMEEERENRRLEEQRLRMQHEYEEEQKKIRAREEETRRKNEELKRQAEEKKKEADRKRREADDARMKEQQEQMEREKREREQREAAASERLKSPPVPAVKAKTNDERGKSPPVPAHRRGRDSAASVRSRTSQRSQQPSPAPGPSANRPNSSDVLTQLASMRKQLQSERRRVENALEHSKNEPDVFDPRTVQRPPPNKLIFENAVNKNASLPPPRAQTTDMANARNIQQFNELKFKADTDSRRAFRSMFPDAPVTNTTLEAQQDAMLRQQEEQLRAMRNKNVEGVNHFPEDFEDMAGVRNDSARARRRERFSPRPFTNTEMGSQASLDIDRIQRKNEERLRRLNNMTTGDDVSMGDPDDILDRFMAKQRYNRPPSGQTLQDDSWLKTDSKMI